MWSDIGHLSKDEIEMLRAYRREKKPWRYKINQKVGDIAESIGVEYRDIHLEWMHKGGNPQASDWITCWASDQMDLGLSCCSPDAGRAFLF